jgi:hypothetical protein
MVRRGKRLRPAASALGSQYGNAGLEPHRPKNLGDERGVTKVHAAERNPSAPRPPDIHARVLTGEISVHAGMVEASCC